MNERPCGRIGIHTISQCADKAARIISEYKIPRAVCLSPDGFVTVENPAHVIDEELVGVYTAGDSLFGLWRQLSDDLLASARERKVTGGRNQMHRVESKNDPASRYDGRECNKCGGVVRYVNSSACVACSNARRTNAKNAQMPPAKRAA
jgi:hypothetical protein